MADELAQSTFLQLLNERVLVFDGAMGTSIHAHDLSLDDYAGLENCVDVVTLTRPDVVAQIHEEFLAAGSDAVETNTFGANKLVLSEFGLSEKTYEMNLRAAHVARAACRKYSTAKQPRFVLGSCGPGTRLPTLRQTTFDILVDSYAEQCRGLLDGGVDAIVIETCQDILQSKSAIVAATQAMQEKGRQVPLIVTVTIETTGTMLVGTDIAAAVVALEAYDQVQAIGLNCATGPQEMSEYIRYLSSHSSRMLAVQPNAGLPQLVDGRPHYALTPPELARWLVEFIEVDGVNIVGGCCGTTPAHLAAVVKAVGRRKPKARSITREPSVSSIYQAVPTRQESSFLIVGERSNTNGSRQFKRLLTEGDLDGMVAMGREQVADGSHVLDVCVDYVGRDGVPDMERVVSRYAQDVTVPLMLDSTEAPVIEAGLKLAGGKCIVNSINLEDGEHKISIICPMLKKYGAAVVALTIDDDPTEAMAKVADRKLEVATRIYDLVVGKYGIKPEDIFFDLLTFPITTGNEADRRLALETLDGIERVSRKYPECNYILGVSNVSFGLVPAARAVLNSVFLYEAIDRGLTAAIVHSSKILPKNKISKERWDAALELIYDRRAVSVGAVSDRDRPAATSDPLLHFIGLFSENEAVGEKKDLKSLPVEDRLRRRIIDGNRLGLDDDLTEALSTYRPLDIINDILLDGMKTVGDLFGAGQMQLPFVLQSAETMKAAVGFLEPLMDRVAGDSKGKIVLATVRGDVHDIGKNLVDIILTNNGYTVYNLGIKQPINSMIEALEQHHADAIGMSGLLVKSTVVMRENLQVLNERGLAPPIILGGAALTRKYVEHDLRPEYHGPVWYAKDAFEGLHLMDELMASRRAGTVRSAGAVRSTDAIRSAGVSPARTAGFQPARGQSQIDAPAEPATDEEDLSIREIAARDAALNRGSDADFAGAVQSAIGNRQPLTPDDGVKGRSAITPVAPRSDIRRDVPIPTPPFWGDRVVERIDLRAVLGWINETMLFQIQWQYKKAGRSSDEFAKYINAEIRPIYRDLVERCIAEEILKPQAIYGYWPCQADGDVLMIFDPHDRQRELVRFDFPRQGKAPYWCLSDFFRPVESGEFDVVAFSIVTMGTQVSEIARQWFAENRYKDYLHLHGLGVESAEALAEYIHKQIRVELGIADHDARDKQAIFKQKYQGSRYSFGYPACPRLEDQVKLWPLLKPQRIGIRLSEEFQMDPEQSTNALICHHPEAKYFNVR